MSIHPRKNFRFSILLKYDRSGPPTSQFALITEFTYFRKASFCSEDIFDQTHLEIVSNDCFLVRLHLEYFMVEFEHRVGLLPAVVAGHASHPPVPVPAVPDGVVRVGSHYESWMQK